MVGSKVWGGRVSVGGVVVGRGNFSGVIGVIGVVDFAMFIQHMPFETLHVFAFKFTDLTLKLIFGWGGGVFIVCDII